MRIIKRVAKWGGGGALLLLLLCIGYVGLTINRAGRGIPVWDGWFEVYGIDGPVEVIRDENGIPHIRASSLRDLYFAQGFVTAQDRFWHLAFMRRIASGRFAEWMGPPVVAVDRRSRLLDTPGLAERAFSAIADEDRVLLEAYADGVNAWLDSPAFRRPPEMVVLHVQPERWRPSDPLLLFYLLQSAYGVPSDELLSDFLARQTQSPGIADAFQRWDSVPTIIGYTRGETSGQTTSPGRDNVHSDSWALSGAHTGSGQPLLANDPHQAFFYPAQWQLQRHQAPGVSGAGATYPGIPGLLVGHNGAIAWGATTAMVDVIDIALLETRPDDPLAYRRASDAPWERFDTRIEEIRVRFGNAVVDTIRSTPFGLVWPDDLDPMQITDRVDRVQERRHWGLDRPGTHFTGWFRLQQATTVESAIDAIGFIPGPPMNITLADTAGSIGYVTMGSIADRPESHARTIGFGDADGNDGEYLPFRENPRVVDPPSGRIVSANQRIVGDEYPHYLGGSWPSPGRAWRVHELLDEEAVHDANTFLRMQTDPLSPVARRLVPFMLRGEAASDEDARLLEVLEAWDYRFTLDSAAPTVFITWLEFINRQIIEDEAGRIPPGGDGGYVYAEFHAAGDALSGKHPEWCDDVTSTTLETCADLLTSTLTETRLALEGGLGSGPEDWHWEIAGRFSIGHAPFGGLPILGKRFSRITPVPGGPDALFNNFVMANGPPPFSTSTTIPSFQGIYDLSDLDSSLFMSYGGSSGHFRSPFYDNLTERWVRGERLQLPAEGVVPISTLTLVPASPDR